MTLAHPNQQDRSVATVPDAAPAVAAPTDLVAHAQKARAAYEYAEIVCGTDFCPAQYRRKPYEAAAAILAGGELGFSPMASLRTFDNIQGVASPKAITQRAVVQSHGHDIWVAESSDTRCVVRGRRKGSDKVVESVWTIERAEQAGYVKKNPNYRTNPAVMLVARASSECARMVASDALLGIPYSSEELRDDSSLREAHPDERNALPSPRAAVRGSTSMTAADLTGEAPLEQPADVSDSVEMSTQAQHKRIGTAFSNAGIGDRVERLRIVASLVDRRVGSAKDLTKPEADDLLASLSDLGDDGLAALATPVDAEVDEPADEALFDEGQQ